MDLSIIRYNIGACSKDEIEYMLNNYTLDELNKWEIIDKLLDHDPGNAKYIAEIIGFPKFWARDSCGDIRINMDYFHILHHKSNLVERDIANVFYNVFAYIHRYSRHDEKRSWDNHIIASILEYYHTPKSEIVICIIGLFLQNNPKLIKLIPGNISKTCFPVCIYDIVLPELPTKVLAKGAI